MKRYGKAEKAQIIQAASSVRAKAGTWAEAFEAAKSAGYRGTISGLNQMVRNAFGKKTPPKPVAPTKGRLRGRKPGPKPVVLVVKRGPGRPRKNPLAVEGFSSIQALVAKVVRERVAGVLDGAIEILQQAKGE
jgi:hypothetical protein